MEQCITRDADQEGRARQLPPLHYRSMGINTLVRWDPFRTRWNPLNDREDLERRLASVLGTREAPGHGGKESLTVAQWSPLVDITEDEKEYLIKAELQNMKRGRAPHGRARGAGNFRRTELREGKKRKKISSGRTRVRELRRRFSCRRMRMGQGVCRLQDGMLHVHLPKSQKEKPKAIEIKVA